MGCAVPTCFAALPRRAVVGQASFQAGALQPLPIYRRRSPNGILRTGRARAAADCKHIHRVVDSRIAAFMHPVSGAVHNSIVLVTRSMSPRWFACCSRALARHVLSTFGALLLLRTAVCARVRSTPSQLRPRCAQSCLHRVDFSGGNVRTCCHFLVPLCIASTAIWPLNA